MRVKPAFTQAVCIMIFSKIFCKVSQGSCSTMPNTNKSNKYRAWSLKQIMRETTKYGAPQRRRCCNIKGWQRANQTWRPTIGQQQHSHTQTVSLHTSRRIHARAALCAQKQDNQRCFVQQPVSQPTPSYDSSMASLLMFLIITQLYVNAHFVIELFLPRNCSTEQCIM